MVPALRLCALLSLAACVDPLTSRATNSPEWEVKNAKGYAETAAGLPPEEVLAWDLIVTGDTARWRECESIEVCGQVERTRPSRELIAVKRVCETTVGGLHVDVLRLSIAARPKYVVPNWKTTQR